MTVYLDEHGEPTSTYLDESGDPLPTAPPKKRVQTRELERQGVTGAEVKRRAAVGEPIVQKGLRRATLSERARSAAVAGLTGLGEGAIQAVTVPLDVLAQSPLAGGNQFEMTARLARAAAQRGTGGVLEEALPLTSAVSRQATRDIAKSRRAVGVKDEVITDVGDEAARLIGNVAAPGPEVVAGAKGVRRLAGKGRTIATEKLPTAERILGEEGAKLAGGAEINVPKPSGRPLAEVWKDYQQARKELESFQPPKDFDAARLDRVVTPSQAASPSFMEKWRTEHPNQKPLVMGASQQEKLAKTVDARQRAAREPLYQRMDALEQELNQTAAREGGVSVDQRPMDQGGGNRVPPNQPSAPPPPPVDPVKKITAALKEAKPLRRQQERIYTAERAKKIEKSVAAREGTSGEAGFYSELGALRGEHTKVQFESLRKQIGQEDIDSLFNIVRDAEPKTLTDFEKINARKGLAKLFGEYGGQVPTESELRLLKRVFGQEFVDTTLAKRPLFDRFKSMALEVANVPRSLMASFDLSAPLRQGVFMIGRPKQFLPAFRDMFKAFGSEKAYQAIRESIESRPSYKLMRDSGLAITDLEAGAKTAGREEQFASSLAERIPIVGRGVRASGRAYTVFLNRLRADVFDAIVTRSQKLGVDVEASGLAKEIASYVNAATGRGELPTVIAGAADVLNAFFFSPRLMASRLTLLNPAKYVAMSPNVRREALRDLFTFVGVGSAVIGLAKTAGAEVGVDPRSADFGKIKVGETRVDVWGGFQQYVRMFAQLASGQYVSTTSGHVRTLGEGYKPVTRYDILMRQIESKEAPIPSFITTMLRQQDYRSRPVNLPKEVAERFAPMVLQDAYAIYKSDPKLLPIELAAIFGVGVQTYEGPNSKKKQKP